MQEIKDTVSLPNDMVACRLFGPRDNYLSILEGRLKAKLVARGTTIFLSGSEKDVREAQAVLGYLKDVAESRELNGTDILYAFEIAERGLAQEASHRLKEVILTTAQGKHIRPKTLGQRLYLQDISTHTITFGIGPAGTGKTYLAVVMAVRALKKREVSRIILTRPAVEAGEKLGFLPGDLQDKVDPYLRPLYDALYDTLGKEVAERYLEKGIIEVAPLAYMRGRTLDDSFIILDEAQNTTPEQMKMFLTRIGFGSRAVVTGDVTQIDLPVKQSSGLLDARRILIGIEEISFVTLHAEDVVRHPVVAKIIRAYDRLADQKENRHETGSGIGTT